MNMMNMNDISEINLKVRLENDINLKKFPAKPILEALNKEELEEIINEQISEETTEKIIKTIAQIYGIEYLSAITTEDIFIFFSDDELQSIGEWIIEERPEFFDTILDFENEESIEEYAQFNPTLKRAFEATDDSSEIEAYYKFYQQYPDLEVNILYIFDNFEDFGREAASIMGDPLPEWAENYFDFEEFGKSESQDYKIIELDNGSMAFIQ